MGGLSLYILNEGGLYLALKPFTPYYALLLNRDVKEAMSLDGDGFTEVVSGGVVSITIDEEHRLVKLAQKLPWEDMLGLIVPDLQRTEKKHWWMGRPLRVRIHCGVYVLQQMFNLTDRVAEQQVRDNAAFRLFCGYGILKNGMPRPY